MEGAVSSTETSTVLPGSVSGIGAESGVSMRSPAKNEMVYPLQLHLPVFAKRHVLVNFSPRCMTALSGIVTSSRSTAASLQAALLDGVPVVAVEVVEASGVKVGGTAVGTDKPGLVGGRVDVTKRGAAGAGVSPETLTHAPRLRHVSRRSMQVFFMARLYNEIMSLTSSTQ